MHPDREPFAVFKRHESQVENWLLSSYIAYEMVYHLKITLPEKLYDEILCRSPCIEKVDLSRWVDSVGHKYSDPNYEELWDVAHTD